MESPATGGQVLLILSHILNNWPVNNHDCVNESCDYNILNFWYKLVFTLYYFFILGRFHQYDGVIRVKEAKEGGAYMYKMYIHYTGQEDSQYRKELLKDVVQSAYVFLPDWQTVIKSGYSGEEMIMRIQSVLKGLQKSYCMLDTVKYVLPSFRKVISAYIYLVDVSSF